MVHKNMVKAGRIILSVLFVFSAVSKLLSLTFFDQLVGELFLGKDFLSEYTGFIYVQIFTRLIISGELILGIALLQEQYFKRVILPFTQFLLMMFTIHLFYEGVSQDNFVSGNCGCFGDVLPMTILESIIKNVVAMVIGGYVWLKYTNPKEMRLQSWIAPVLAGVVCFATIALTIKDYTPKTFSGSKATEVNPEFSPSEKKNNVTDSSNTEPSDSGAVATEEIDSAEVSKTVQKKVVKKPEIKPEITVEKDNTKVDEPDPVAVTKGLLDSYNTFSDGTSMNLEEGTTLVCMFSMTCSHCQEVYRNICEIRQFAGDKLPEIYLLNYGRELEQSYFFNQAGECMDAHIRIDDYAEFMRILEGETFPRMLVFKDGDIVKRWDVDSYSKEDFMDYFGIEEPEEKEEGLQLENNNSWGIEEEKEPWE